MLNRKKIQKKQRSSFIVVIWILGILLVSFLAVSAFSALSLRSVSSPNSLFIWESLNFSDAIDKKNNSTIAEQQRLFKKNEEEKLKMKNAHLAQLLNEKENKTNILIVGRGGKGNDAPELTDSILLLSFHKTKNHITILSIPRDLYVQYNDRKVSWKINGLYVHYLAKYQNSKKAIKKLQEKITEITDEKIDYSINLDFWGFVNLVNSLWWVHIEVPKTLIDNKYPNNNHGYQTFILKKGKWLLNWKTALKYARSRKNTWGDFWRSQRQQQIIEALKDKMFSGGFISSPSKIKKLYEIFDKNVVTDLDFVWALELFATVKLQENTKVYSSWLNATCWRRAECDKWGYLYYPQRKFFKWQSVLLSESSSPKNLDIYASIRKYSKLVFTHPQVFEEDYKISLFSTQNNKKIALTLQKELKQLGFNVKMNEKIWNIPSVPYKISSSWREKNEKKMNLLEYIEHQNKNKKKFITNEQWQQDNNDISQEFWNDNTKIIINTIENTSETVKYLQKKLNISDDNVVNNWNSPKYAKDKNTQIEIIYKP